MPTMFVTKLAINASGGADVTWTAPHRVSKLVIRELDTTGTGAGTAAWRLARVAGDIGNGTYIVIPQGGTFDTSCDALEGVNIDKGSVFYFRSDGGAMNLSIAYWY